MFIYILPRARVVLNICKKEKNLLKSCVYFHAGVEFVGGDMFVSVPSGGDAIFMKVGCFFR